MEIHRLKPMKEGYSEVLFNKIYSETHNLRKSLARSIDHKKYGVSPDIVLSWFDDKFIFVFNKHFSDKNPDVLKGFIINSLKTFKYRVLRKAYTRESEFIASTVKLEGETNLINIIPDEPIPTENIFLDYATKFMKDNLTDDAHLIFELQLNPPPFILNRLVKSTAKINNELLLEFLGITDTTKTNRYITTLKKQITEQTKIAREYFINNPLAIT